MKSKHLSVPLVGCIALAPAIAGCSGTSDPLAEEATPAHAAAAQEGQTRIALATLTLENEFSDQFRRAAIDRAALQPAVDDVVQAMSEGERPRVRRHIADVLDKGEKLAPQLTAEQRAAATAAPAEGQLDGTQIGIITAWGFPGAVGWGGAGAFGFPGMLGFGTSFGTGFSSGYSTASSYSTGFSTGTSCGFGFGCFGLGGLGWAW